MRNPARRGPGRVTKTSSGPTGWTGPAGGSHRRSRRSETRCGHRRAIASTGGRGILVARASPCTHPSRLPRLRRLYGCWTAGHRRSVAGMCRSRGGLDGYPSVGLTRAQAPVRSSFSATAWSGPRTRHDAGSDGYAKALQSIHDGAWRVGAVAAPTGLTVRTLHHRDRIGLPAIGRLLARAGTRRARAGAPATGSSRGPHRPSDSPAHHSALRSGAVTRPGGVRRPAM